MCLSADYWTLIIISQWLKIDICVSWITFDMGQNILCLQITWLSELPWKRQRPSSCQIFIVCHNSMIRAFERNNWKIIQRVQLLPLSPAPPFFVRQDRVRRYDPKITSFFSIVATENGIVHVMCQFGQASDDLINVFLGKITFYNEGGPHPVNWSHW